MYDSSKSVQNKLKEAQTINISHLRGGHVPEAIDMPFGVLSGIPDVNTHAKFYLNWYFKLVKGFLGSSTLKMAISYTFSNDLTTVLHYHADCDWPLSSGRQRNQPS